MDDDLVVLQRWCDGDQRAGQALCARYFAEIYRFFEHKISGEADDLTQQTFLACVKARSRFQGHSTFRTYLFAIARNELYMRLRKSSRFQHVDLEVSSLNELVDSPSTELRKHEERAQLVAALRALPVEQQVLLEYRYWYDLDAAALAEIYRSKVGAIRVRLLRARRALRDRLGANTVHAEVGDRLSRSLIDPDIDDDGDVAG